MGFKDKDGKYRPTENNDSKSNHPDAERADEHHGKVFDSIDKHEADDLKKQKIGKLINKEKCVMCGHDKKWLWFVTHVWND